MQKSLKSLSIFAFTAIMSFTHLASAYAKGGPIQCEDFGEDSAWDWKTRRAPVYINEKTLEVSSKPNGPEFKAYIECLLPHCDPAQKYGPGMIEKGIGECIGGNAVYFEGENRTDIAGKAFKGYLEQLSYTGFYAYRLSIFKYGTNIEPVSYLRWNNK